MKDGFQIGGRNRTHSCSGCAAPNLHEHKRLTPDPLDDTQPEAGIPPEDQVQLALGALTNMGLTKQAEETREEFKLQKKQERKL